MSFPAKAPEFITKAGLVGKRNWTETAISNFLGDPEKTVPNSHYRNGHPVNLYALQRVERVEQTPEFKHWMKLSSVRKEASQSAVETKKRKLLEYVEALKIEVPDFPMDGLLRRAVQNYNDHHYSIQERRERDWDWEPATVEGARLNWEFGQRITVNYLRHELTTYERNLSELFGRTGVDEGRRMLRVKVYAAIAQAYPELAAECREQQAKREAQGC